MIYKTIIVNKEDCILRIIFNRLSRRNSINREFLIDLNAALDEAESDSTCKLVIMEGQDGIFCTGMDFQEVNHQVDIGSEDNDSQASDYINILKRFTLTSKIIVAKVDGQVMAGGVGLVAASDLVISTPRSQFSLSETLWGLLPAIVTPFLIRRVGFQPAYRMTLTTLPITAADAQKINLIDELSDNPESNIGRLAMRLTKLDALTVSNVKKYFRKMWLVTDEMEQTAVLENIRLMSNEQVKENIVNYVKFKKFPWENY